MPAFFKTLKLNLIKVKSVVIEFLKILTFCLILTRIVKTVPFFSVNDYYLFSIIGWGGFFSVILHVNKFINRKRYLIPMRLEDVIRLLTALSLDKHSFKSELKVVDALRGRPLSATSWKDLASQHPEFFRSNKEDTSIALTMRSYNPIGEENSREPLGISETQKLVDVAITLYEKQMQSKLQYSTWFPLIGAVIGALAVIATNLLVKSGH
jgi:hypothetical protein